MIFDTHAHYDDEQFDEDRDELLASMQECGVEAVTNIGASLATSQNTIELTKKYPFVYGAIGVHPNEVEDLNEDGIAWLKENSVLPKIVAVGEIGLDYYWDEPGPVSYTHLDVYKRQVHTGRERWRHCGPEAAPCSDRVHCRVCRNNTLHRWPSLPNSWRRTESSEDHRCYC